ncbi:MAG: hypothetical protein WAM14_13020 [Candidatus Nitrosopolaris sp.]
MNRMIFVPVLMATTIAAMMTTVPVITMPQIAKAYLDCSLPLTQDDRYYCGYNQGYIDAQRDWNSQRWTVQSVGMNPRHIDRSKFPVPAQFNPCGDPRLMAIQFNQDDAALPI